MTTTTQILRPTGLATSSDEILLDALNFLIDNKGKLEEEVYDSYFKSICNLVRSSIGIENVVGFAFPKNSEEPEVHIFIYDIEATEYNFFIQNFDEKGPYLDPMEVQV